MRRVGQADDGGYEQPCGAQTDRDDGGPLHPVNPSLHRTEVPRYQRPGQSGEPRRPVPNAVDLLAVTGNYPSD
jgi:hypothetical protein